ncbi:MAG TPA: hypothetical protein VID47_10135 [Actinomycetota bacterium]|jgi:hypothetical protein
MNDLDQRFREADELEVRDIWPQIEGRHPMADLHDRPRHRVLALVTAVLVAGVGIATAVRALHGATPHVLGIAHTTVPATAFDLAGAIRTATGQCADIEAPFGIPPEGASGWIQCHFDGTVLDLLSFDSSRSMPSHSTGLHGRVEIIGPRWFADADNLNVARQIQGVIGGRIWIAPRFVQPSVDLDPQCPPGLHCPSLTMPTVRFRLGFANPFDRAAVMTCFARGLADGKVTFHTRKLRGPQLAAGASGTLDETLRLSPPANVMKIVAWCDARPVHQLIP